jgi:putative two-component system response regulator
MSILDFDTFGLRLLCIDDSKTQLLLYTSELDGMFSVSTASTYEEAIAQLTSSQPDLILLDMNMPRVSGLEFLDILSSTPHYAQIPVIIVSGENDPAYVKEAFIRGAADYVRKPYDSEELILRITRIFRLVSGHRDAAEKRTAGKSAQILLVESLADLASAKDNENTGHLQRIGLYSREIAAAAAASIRFRTDISEEFVQKIADMAALHDIGKVNIPEYILSKEGPLTDREFDHIKRHTTDGARTIDMIRLSFPDYAFLDFARDIILYHHERWDGSGYPEGKTKQDIPLASRIVAIADAFDTMTLQRRYAEAKNFDTAFEEILAAQGTVYDPDLVVVFRLIKNRIKDIYDKNRDQG